MWRLTGDGDSVRSKARQSGEQVDVKLSAVEIQTNIVSP